MRILAPLLLLALVPACAAAYQWEPCAYVVRLYPVIEGRVFDGASGEPLPASVSLRLLSVSGENLVWGRADEDGRFRFILQRENFSYELGFGHPGYENKRLSGEIGVAGYRYVEAGLEYDPFDLEPENVTVQGSWQERVVDLGNVEEENWVENMVVSAEDLERAEKVLIGYRRRRNLPVYRYKHEVRHITLKFNWPIGITIGWSDWELKDEGTVYLHTWQGESFTDGEEWHDGWRITYTWAGVTIEETLPPDEDWRNYGSWPPFKEGDVLAYPLGTCPVTDWQPVYAEATSGLTLGPDTKLEPCEWEADVEEWGVTSKELVYRYDPVGDWEFLCKLPNPDRKTGTYYSGPYQVGDQWYENMKKGVLEYETITYYEYRGTCPQGEIVDLDTRWGEGPPESFQATVKYHHKQGGKWWYESINYYDHFWVVCNKDHGKSFTTTVSWVKTGNSYKETVERYYWYCYRQKLKRVYVGDRCIYGWVPKGRQTFASEPKNSSTRRYSNVRVTKYRILVKTLDNYHLVHRFHTLSLPEAEAGIRIVPRNGYENTARIEVVPLAPTASVGTGRYEALLNRGTVRVPFRCSIPWLGTYGFEVRGWDGNGRPVENRVFLVGGTAPSSPPSRTEKTLVNRNPLGWVGSRNEKPKPLANNPYTEPPYPLTGQGREYVGIGGSICYEYNFYIGKKEQPQTRALPARQVKMNPLVLPAGWGLSQELESAIKKDVTNLIQARDYGTLKDYYGYVNPKKTRRTT
ncbi:MAG: hypothetical protein QXK27_02165 [Candidatus Hadarchaeales archaeon]